MYLTKHSLFQPSTFSTILSTFSSMAVQVALPLQTTVVDMSCMHVHEGASDFVSEFSYVNVVTKRSVLPSRGLFHFLSRCHDSGCGRIICTWHWVLFLFHRALAIMGRDGCIHPVVYILSSCLLSCCVVPCRHRIWQFWRELRRNGGSRDRKQSRNGKGQ